MKRVSFKVAKAIKEAGYPQDYKNGGFTIEGYKVNPQLRSDEKVEYSRPTYLEVWLWLWREKRICIDTDSVWVKNRAGCSIMIDDKTVRFIERDDPEEAIIAAVEHLVTNDLVK